MGTLPHPVGGLICFAVEGLGFRTPAVSGLTPYPRLPPAACKQRRSCVTPVRQTAAGPTGWVVSRLKAQGGSASPGCEPPGCTARFPPAASRTVARATQSRAERFDRQAPLPPGAGCTSQHTPPCGRRQAAIPDRGPTPPPAAPDQHVGPGVDRPFALSSCLLLRLAAGYRHTSDRSHLRQRSDLTSVIWPRG